MSASPTATMTATGLAICQVLNSTTIESATASSPPSLSPEAPRQPYDQWDTVAEVHLGSIMDV